MPKFLYCYNNIRIYSIIMKIKTYNIVHNYIQKSKNPQYLTLVYKILNKKVIKATRKKQQEKSQQMKKKSKKNKL